MVGSEATVYLLLDIEFTISSGRKRPSPGTDHEGGPSIRGPRPEQCAAGVHAGAGAGAGTRAGTGYHPGKLVDYGNGA